MTDNLAVTGIVEAALYVEQVARSMDFYRDLFGFEEELRAEAIGVLRVPGRQALILFRAASHRRHEPVLPRSRSAPDPAALAGVVEFLLKGS